MADTSSPLVRIRDLVQELALRPHPEGGHYREVFRSTLGVQAPFAQRAASTAIYYLLCRGERSRWHRVRSDEVWHWYEGDPVELLCAEHGAAPVHRAVLGGVEGGRRPLAVVPAGWWQAAQPLGGYALMGCTVAPGFDFADFAIIEPASQEAAWLRTQADPRLVDGAG